MWRKVPKVLKNRSWRGEVPNISAVKHPTQFTSGFGDLSGATESPHPRSRLRLEGCSRQPGLADDGAEGPSANLAVQGNGHRYRRPVRQAALHHEMTASLADSLEAVALEEVADLLAGKDAEPSQRRGRIG
jgi:hypothetical protein